MKISNTGFLKILIPKIGTENEVTREKWVSDKLSSIPKGKRLLDAGAGTQQYRKYCQHLIYVSQDNCKYDGTGNSLGLQTEVFDYQKIDIESDIISIPEPDQSFDYVLCTEVLEHIPNPELAIREFSRLLKPGGELILTAPFCSLTHFAPAHYQTGFSKYFFEYTLPKHQMEILEILPNGNYFQFLAQEIRRLRHIAEKYSNKKINLIELFFLWVVLNLLEKLNKGDANSDVLLCYGYHVTAKKTS